MPPTRSTYLLDLALNLAIQLQAILQGEGSRKVEKGGLICTRGISVHSTRNRACLPHASGCMCYGEQIIFQAISAKFDTRFT